MRNVGMRSLPLKSLLRPRGSAGSGGRRQGSGATQARAPPPRMLRGGARRTHVEAASAGAPRAGRSRQPRDEARAGRRHAAGTKGLPRITDSDQLESRDNGCRRCGARGFRTALHFTANQPLLAIFFLQVNETDGPGIHLMELSAEVILASFSPTGPHRRCAPGLIRARLSVMLL